MVKTEKRTREKDKRKLFFFLPFRSIGKATWLSIKRALTNFSCLKISPTSFLLLFFFISLLHGQYHSINLFSRAQENVSLAKNEQQKRRRPIIDNIAQDSDGNYIDQIASDSINYAQPHNGLTGSENYPRQYHAGMRRIWNLKAY